MKLETGSIAQIVSAGAAVVSLGIAALAWYAADRALHTDTVYLHTSTVIEPGWGAHLGPSGIMDDAPEEVEQLALQQATFSQLVCSSFLESDDGRSWQHFTVEGRTGPCGGPYTASFRCISPETSSRIARCVSDGKMSVNANSCWYFLAKFDEKTSGDATLNCGVEKYQR